jgi:hypothetical protein
MEYASNPSYEGDEGMRIWFLGQPQAKKKKKKKQDPK